jgi:autotransporter-associated beta strand protein
MAPLHDSSDRQRPFSSFRLAGLLVAALAWPAHSAPLTWDGGNTGNAQSDGGDGTWDTNTTANWWNGATDVLWPVAGGLDDDAIFGDAAGTVTVNGVNANDLTFNTTGYLLQGGTLTLDGATPTITAGPGVSATISSIIAGASGLTKAGAGTITLQGVNTYTGGTTLGASAGTLIARITTTQNSLSTGAVAIGTGSTVQIDKANTTGDVTIANAFSGAGTLQVLLASGGTARNTYLTGLSGLTGTLRLSNAGATGDKFNAGNAGTTAAALIVDAGSQLFMNTGTAAFNGGITVQGTGNTETRGAIRLIGTLGGNVTLAGNTTIGTEGGVLSGNITSGAAGTQTLTFGTAGSIGNASLSGIIGGGTGTIALVKTQAGTVTLTGVNTFTGGTVINASSGTLSARITIGQTALGTGAVSVGAGSTLVLDNVNTANNTVVTVSNAVTGTGTVRLNFAAGGSPRNTTLPGLTGFTGTLRLSNSGGNADKWNAANYTLNAALIIDSGSQLYVNTGAVSITGGINLQGTGNTENRGAIRLGNTLNASLALAANASIGTEGGTLNGNITSGAAGTQTLTFGTSSSTGNTTVNGNIGGGTGTLAVTKTQAGTLTLNGVHTYNGQTTAAGGTLLLPSTASLATSGVLEAQAGATLTLSGPLTLTGAGMLRTQTGTGTGTINISTGVTVTHGGSSGMIIGQNTANHAGVLNVAGTYTQNAGSAMFGNNVATATGTLNVNNGGVVTFAAGMNNSGAAGSGRHRGRGAGARWRERGGEPQRRRHARVRQGHRARHRRRDLQLRWRHAPCPGPEHGVPRCHRQRRQHGRRRGRLQRLRHHPGQWPARRHRRGRPRQERRWRPHPRGRQHLRGRDHGQHRIVADQRLDPDRRPDQRVRRGHPGRRRIGRRGHPDRHQRARPRRRRGQPSRPGLPDSRRPVHPAFRSRRPSRQSHGHGARPPERPRGDARCAHARRQAAHQRPGRLRDACRRRALAHPHPRRGRPHRQYPRRRPGQLPALASGLTYVVDTGTDGYVYLGVVPEAGTAGLVALGLALLARRRR